MKKCLAFMWEIDSVYHFNDEGDKIYGPHQNLTNVNKALMGDVSDIFGDASNIFGRLEGLRGDISGVIGSVVGKYGDISKLTGCVSSIVGCTTGIKGDASGFSGDLDESNLTDEEKQIGIDIKDLWIGH